MEVPDIVGFGDWLQRPKDLLQPLLEGSDAAVGLGHTWRGSRGSNPVPDLERGLETAVTVESDYLNDPERSVRKEVPTAGEVPKARAASSNLGLPCEFLVTKCYLLSYFTSYEADGLFEIILFFKIQVSFWCCFRFWM